MTVVGVLFQKGVGQDGIVGETERDFSLEPSCGAPLRECAQALLIPPGSNGSRCIIRAQDMGCIKTA